MKNKNNKILYSCIGLGILGVGLFGYDVLYFKAKSDSVMYVANKDLPSETVLSSDMFKQIKVSKEVVLPNYVTNIDEIKGKELRGGLLKDEPLSKGRLVSSDENRENLEIKVEADVLTPVETNDFINVYVILKSNTGKVEVRRLFETKKVYRKSYTDENKTKTYFTIKVDEAELKKYYDAKEKGKIVVAKFNGIDGNKDITKNVYNPDSLEAKTAVKEKDEKGVAVITKKVENGDTLESLAKKYDVSQEDIKTLNNKDKFNEGEDVLVPVKQ